MITRGSFHLYRTLALISVVSGLVVASCDSEPAESDCPFGQSKCNGICVDTANDQSNCGECGNICLDNEDCQNGMCVPCENECPAQADHICDGDGYRICGSYDADLCLEWSEIIPCGDGQTCNPQTAQCETDCADECLAIDAQQCSGDGYVVCGNHDADACLEWSVPYDCPIGQVCNPSTNQCVDVDECPNEVLQGQCGILAHGTAPGFNTGIQQYPSCTSETYAGSEYVFSWTAPCEAMIRVGLTNIDSGVDVDLFVLENVCDGNACLDHSTHATQSDYVWFVSEAGREYSFVAESIGSAGGFDIVVSCSCGTSWEICDNGIDDDGYLGADCDDLKCTYRPECGQPFCDFRVPIICGDTYVGESNAGPGASNIADDYCGLGTGIWTGPEMVYAFHSHQDCSVTVSTTAAQDIDLFILDPCDPTSCITLDGVTAGQGNETASFSATAFMPYYFVVEGRNGVITDYDIEVTCVGH